MRSEVGYDFIFKQGISTEFVLKMIKSYLEFKNELDIKMKIAERPGKDRTIDEIIEYHCKYKKNDFILCNDEYEMTMGQNNGCVDVFVYTKQDSNENTSNCLVSFFCNGYQEEYLLSARSYSCAYNITQVCISKDLFEYWGLDYKHLTIIDYGHVTRIDTSKNPGRWYFRDGYKESISAEMYISREFCKRTGADFEQIKHTSWLKTEELTSDIIRFVAWPHPFNNDRGEQADVQNRLRKLLYPITYDKPEHWTPDVK